MSGTDRLTTIKALLAVPPADREPTAQIASGGKLDSGWIKDAAIVEFASPEVVQALKAAWNKGQAKDLRVTIRKANA